MGKKFLWLLSLCIFRLLLIYRCSLRIFYLLLLSYLFFVFAVSPDTSYIFIACESSYSFDDLFFGLLLFVESRIWSESFVCTFLKWFWICWLLLPLVFLFRRWTRNLYIMFSSFFRSFKGCSFSLSWSNFLPCYFFNCLQSFLIIVCNSFFILQLIIQFLESFGLLLTAHRGTLAK
jgi:hypothetical protein